MNAAWLPPFGTFAGEAARAALVSAALLVLFVASELWRRRWNPPTEWTRKLVHFGSGVVAASFPWMFASHWTVLALGASFAVIILATRRLGLLGSVHAVERRSEGGLYYPLAIYLLFALGASRPIFYLISLLVLMVSDTVAALLGTEYGRRIYAVERDHRSLEGSGAFLLATFFAVHLPLLLLTDTPRAATVLVAAQIALTVTILEGISVGGSDNLVTPLATYFMLTGMTRLPAYFLAGQLTVQLVVTLLVLLLAWRYRFVAMSTAMGLALVVYGAYALGGAEWTIAPALAVLIFVIYYAVARRVAPDAPSGYQVRGLFYVAIVPTMLFFLDYAFEHAVVAPIEDPLYVPFVGAAAAQLMIVFFAHLQEVPRRRRRRLFWLRAGSALLGFLVVVPIGLALSGTGATAWGLLCAAAVCAVSLALYFTVRRLPAWPRVAPWGLRLQMLSTAAATALVVPVHLWRIGAV